MSILGLTIDYGPFGFLDKYDPGHICNASGVFIHICVHIYIMFILGSVLALTIIGLTHFFKMADVKPPKSL